MSDNRNHFMRDQNGKWRAGEEPIPIFTSKGLIQYAPDFCLNDCKDDDAQTLVKEFEAYADILLKG